jgi:hypothetical protein
MFLAFPSCRDGWSPTCELAGLAICPLGWILRFSLITRANVMLRSKPTSSYTDRVFQDVCFFHISRDIGISGHCPKNRLAEDGGELITS